MNLQVWLAALFDHLGARRLCAGGNGAGTVAMGNIRATGAVTAAGQRRRQHVAEAIRPHLTAAPKPAAYLETLRLPGSQ